MTDIFINQVSGDIDITGSRIILLKDPVEALRQRLTIRLKTFKGEWMLNVNAGLPYYQEIFQKGISKDLVDNIFRGFILRTPSVERVTSFSSTLDSRQRTYTLTFTVFTDKGVTLTIKDFEV